jgi:hypothetical protein
MQAGLEKGYALADEEPEAALDELLEGVEGLERGTQEEQMEALVDADAFASGATPGTLEPQRYANWKRFARANGIAVPQAERSPKASRSPEFEVN